MKTWQQRLNTCCAFHLGELVVVLLVLAVVISLVISALSRPNCCKRVSCGTILKQAGIGFSTWAADHGNRFPMQCSTNEGGTMEWRESTNVFLHFAVMSNELNTPKVLICPADAKRTAATNFGSDLDNSKISYFVGIDAALTNSTMLLSGDRNLNSERVPSSPFMLVASNSTVHWSRQMHNRHGYVLFVDGHVEFFNDSELTQRVQRWPCTNRLALP